MSLFLWVVLPLGYAVLGKTIGWAVAASFFFGSSGKRLGRTLANRCIVVLPCVFLVLLLLGLEGDAGHGFGLFGSDVFLDILCALPFYGTLALGIYAAGIYVLRDLTIGHETDVGQAAGLP